MAHLTWTVSRLICDVITRMMHLQRTETGADPLK